MFSMKYELLNFLLLVLVFIVDSKSSQVLSAPQFLESSSSIDMSRELKTFEDVRHRVEKFCTDRDWSKYHTPVNLVRYFHHIYLFIAARFLTISFNSYKLSRY